MSRESEVSSDILELKGVLEAIGDFLGSITPKLRELLGVLFEQFNGESVGRDVANFYKQIKTSGLDEETAREMTMKYFEERISVVKILNEILSAFKKEISS